MTLANIVGIPVYLIYKYAWVGVDLLYPPTCGGCEDSGERWCSACHDRTRLIIPPLCRQCGQQLIQGDKCRQCENHPPDFISLRSWAVYEGPVRNAIRRLKYRGDVALGDVLARPMINLLYEQNWRVDIVTPVPMGRVRSAERGYNQAALLALPIALSMGVAYRSKALKKERNIESQVGLSLEERYRNVCDAFQADEKIVQGKSILVVDDVITSGATMNACAGALLDALAKCVYGITLARAGLY